jgi:hypothetical protein
LIACAGVIHTSGIFTADVNDTGDNDVDGIQPVSMTPVVNKHQLACI